jgi:hypothetical protein
VKGKTVVWATGENFLGVLTTNDKPKLPATLRENSPEHNLPVKPGHASHDGGTNPLLA